MISLSYINSFDDSEHTRFYQVKEKSIGEFAALTTTNVWSAIIWSGGYRNIGNFLECAYCMLDVDNGQYLNKFCSYLMSANLTHFITTTRNHQREKDGVVADRFRAVIKLARPITSVDHYAWFMEYVGDKFGIIDRQAKDAARKFLPGINVVQAHEGKSLDFPNLPSNYITTDERNKRYKNYVQSYGRARMFPPWVKSGLNNGFPTGKRNIRTFGLACDLVRMGLAQTEIESLILNSRIGLPEHEVKVIIKKAIRYNS